MNKEMMRLCYEAPVVEYIQLSAPLNILTLFSSIDGEVDQWEEGEDLDVV